MNTQNQLTDILDEFPELKSHVKELEALIDCASKENHKSHIDPKFKSSLRAKILEKASQNSSQKKPLFQRISLSSLFRYGFAPAFTFFCIVGIFALWNQGIKQTLVPVYNDSSTQISPASLPKGRNTETQKQSETPKAENTSPKDTHENLTINTTLSNNTKEHNAKKVSPSETHNTKYTQPNSSEVPLQKSSQGKPKQQDTVQENTFSQPLYSSRYSSDTTSPIENDIEYIESQVYAIQEMPLSALSFGENTLSEFEVFCQNSDGYTKTGTLLSLCIRENSVCSEIDFDIHNSRCLWKGKVK